MVLVTAGTDIAARIKMIAKLRMSSASENPRWEFLAGDGVVLRSALLITRLEASGPKSLCSAKREAYTASFRAVPHRGAPVTELANRWLVIFSLIPYGAKPVVAFLYLAILQ